MPEKKKTKRVANFGLKTLSISTAYATVVGTPGDKDTAKLEDVKTMTKVGWPLNWRDLSPRWRAIITARLVMRVLGAVLCNGSPNRNEATFEEFKKITGWGSGTAKVSKKQPEKMPGEKRKKVKG